MKPSPQLAHAFGHFRWGGRYEDRVTGSRAAKPVLAATEFSWILVGASTVGQQNSVHLPNEPVGEWEAVVDAVQAMFERGDVAGHLGDVINRDAWCLFRLEQEEVGKRGFRAFDLGGQHGLLPHICIEEEVRIR